jgi:endoglucanase
MERKVLLGLARRVLRLPTAPYHEHHVRAFVIAYCRQLGVPVEMDRAGNVITRYRHRQTGAPLVFCAHMDHPGFEALGPTRAEFLGGVPKEMFTGATVRFFCDGGAQRAQIKRLDDSRWPACKIVDLRGATRLQRGDFGMWDVPAVAVRGDRLLAAAIDDVLSVVVALATLRELKRSRAAAHVWAVFTRAEEVGFHGAIELARSGRIPRSALVVSLEMSRERPWARMGDGPIVRVGDRMTMFDPLASLFLHEVARRRTLPVQRCLMDGGSTEATAFGALGYRAGGLCLPLGNYHNIGRDGRPRAEYVSVRDLMGLVELAVAVARDWKEFGGARRRLRAQVLAIGRAAPRKLM